VKKPQKTVTRKLFIEDLGVVQGGKIIYTTLAIGEESGDDPWLEAAGPLEPTTLAVGEECIYPEP
jgi:hypothetical protein